MKGWDTVFFPPSQAFAEDMAKRLKSVTGARWMRGSHARNLLSQIYGCADWNEMHENLVSDWGCVTVWDDELDADTLEQRKEIQVNAVAAYLNVSGRRAASILNELRPSARECPPIADDLEDFCQKLDELLTRVRGMQTGESGTGRSPSQLVRPSTRRAPAHVLVPKSGKSRRTGSTHF